MSQLFYDPSKTFDENIARGPWLEAVTYQGPATQPQYSLLGKKVHLPFGIASSSVVASSAQVEAAFNRGFDVITFKTQRSTVFPVNPFPNIIPIDVDGPVSLERIKQGLTLAKAWGEDSKRYSITNSFGNPSRGPAYWLPKLKKAAASTHPGQILIASVTGTIQKGFSDDDYFNDFATAARIANKAPVSGIEIDTSCANVASEGIVCYKQQSVAKIIPLVKNAIGNTPLLVKIAYFSSEQQKLLEEIITDIAPYISGVSAINAISTAIRKKDGTPALPGEGRLMSGLSGVAIKWAGLDMVRRLDKLREDKGYTYEIFGMGGVMTPADYKEYREAGADCVQSVAGVIWNPNLAAEIKQFLA